MTSYINRVTAVRLVVLIVAAALALTWVHMATSSTTETPTAAVVAPAEQSVRSGVSLAPEAATLPAPQPAQPSGDRAGSKPDLATRGHAARAHRQAQRNARHARAQRHRAHKATNPWRHSGGRDIGWPQCSRNVGFGGRNGLGQPMPDPGVRFVVVGLTNGRAFTPNPCLDAHLRWARDHHVAASAYAFAAFPSRAQLRRHRHHGPYDGRTGFGALKNAGYAAARYNIRVMQQNGFTTPHVWLDVEPSSSHPWSHRRQLNRAVARGWIRGYRDAGYSVGVYSTPLLWRHILGSFRPRLPEWRTAGPASASAALGKCGGESIQGGRAVIAQWWTSRRDFDRLCPSPSRRTTLARYFHQW